MLDKRFCYLAGTGRTGTHWFYMLFKRFANDVNVAPFHDRLPSRLKSRGNARAMLTNYLLNVMCRNQRARIYIECNPALVEWVGLQFSIKSARNVIPSDLLLHPVKSALVVRHPFGYVKSLKAKPWAWNWHSLPGMNGAQWKRWGKLEQMCYAWNIKNLFYRDLLADGHCILIKFESVFGDDREQAVKAVRRIAGHFGVQLTISGNQIEQFRQRRFAAKGGYALTLTSGEQDTCRRICGEVMRMFGYA